MSIKSIHITNYKSLRNVVITQPNPFTVFVGANASGKSNIFEAIDFISSSERTSTTEVLRKFEGENSIANRKWVELAKPFKGDLLKTNPINGYGQLAEQLIGIMIDVGEYVAPSTAIYKSEQITLGEKESKIYFGHSSWLLGIKNSPEYQKLYNPEVVAVVESKNYVQFLNNCSRIFVKNKDTDRDLYSDDFRLSTACGNLEQVLKRILLNDTVKREMIDWLQLLIPGFETLEITTEPYSKTDSLLIYEKGEHKPFTKNLISDGTFNIISLLAAVYQSEEPQFLCIEEPENGLNPKVIKELVVFFREQCEEKGHYIWLNTHSQTLVRELRPEEVILVDKKEGATNIKQLAGMNLHGLKMDEALLSGVLGGGIPW